MPLDSIWFLYVLLFVEWGIRYIVTWTFVWVSYTVKITLLLAFYISNFSTPTIKPLSDLFWNCDLEPKNARAGEYWFWYIVIDKYNWKNFCFIGFPKFWCVEQYLSENTHDSHGSYNDKLHTVLWLSQLFQSLLLLSLYRRPLMEPDIGIKNWITIVYVDSYDGLKRKIISSYFEILHTGNMTS